MGTNSINNRSRHDELRNTACGSEALNGGRAVSKDILSSFLPFSPLGTGWGFHSDDDDDGGGGGGDGNRMGIPNLGMSYSEFSSHFVWTRNTRRSTVQQLASILEH